MKRLIIASNNKGKINEFKQLLQPLGYDVMSQSEAGISIDVDENGNTFEENARLKSTAIYDMVCKDGNNGDVAVLADDSGLQVDYLNGEPGVYSSRYAPEGQRKQKILDKLNGVPIENRTARFVCSICYIDGDGEKSVNGECEGYIGFECRGSNGFGYDPIFMVKSIYEASVDSPVFYSSFAEISDSEKNLISHRGIALRKLVEILK